jgi:hypothetical protein
MTNSDTGTPKYSGKLSQPFWEAVNKLPRSENAVVYSLGCALQDLESRVLTALRNAQNSNKRGR